MLLILKNEDPVDWVSTVKAPINIHQLLLIDHHQKAINYLDNNTFNFNKTCYKSSARLARNKVAIRHNPLIYKAKNCTNC